MKEKIAYIRDISIVTVAILGAGFLGIKFILPAVLPFIIAWGIAFLTRRPSDFLAEKTRVSKKFYRPVLSVLLMLLVIGGAVFAIVKISAEAWELLTSLGEDGAFEKIISYITSPFEELSARIGIAPELEGKLSDAIYSMFSEILSGAASVITSVASAVPGIFLFVLVTAISTVYFSLDLENVNKRVHNMLPKAWDKRLVNFKNSTFSVLVKYVRSYLLIMLLTFAVMLFGLSVIGVRYSLLMAFIIALLDLLPVIGIGIVLVPWGVFMLTVGNNVKMGVELLILYAVGTVVRQVAEPKIVGKELGIHPLLTLVLMYAGYSLFGVMGLIILPLLSVGITAFGKNDTAKVKE